MAPHITRAGLIAFFVLADSSAFVSASVTGLVDRDVVWLTLALLLLPSSMFGGYVGSKLFKRFGGEKFKPVTIGLVIVIAFVSAGRVLL